MLIYNLFALHWCRVFYLLKGSFMKLFYALAAAGVIAVSSDAFAGIDENMIATLVGNKTICATYNSDKWQEFHSGTTSGPLSDYKKGPSDPVDPSKTVGTWSIEGSGTTAKLVHDYGSGGIFKWEVTASNQLVGNGKNISFTTQEGQTACP